MLRILLVDDDPMDNYLTMSLLTNCGTDIEISMCTDGERAWKKLHEMHRLPDVILLDLHMPACDGFELLSRIKHNPIKGSQEMKLVVLSLTKNPHDVQMAKKLGATGFLTKPLNIDELRLVLS